MCKILEIISDKCEKLIFIFLLSSLNKYQKITIIKKKKKHKLCNEVKKNKNKWSNRNTSGQIDRVESSVIMFSEFSWILKDRYKKSKISQPNSHFLFYILTLYLTIYLPRVKFFIQTKCSVAFGRWNCQRLSLFPHEIISLLHFNIQLQDFI